MATGESTKVVIAAFFANLGIAIAKFIGFVFTGSSSMLAEAIHSTADTGNQALLLLGGRLSKRDPDAEFQFGYARERYFWAFVVALVLFSLGSLFAIYEGIEKIGHPHELENVGWAFAILSLGIVFEGFAFMTAVRASIPIKGDRTWWQFIRTSRVAELTVVLLEDFGALIGLVIALTAIATATITGDPIWDGIGTLSIGILLGVIAILLAIEMKGLLIGESARPGEYQKIKEAMLTSPSVVDVIHLRTQHFGPQQLLVGAKIVFDSDLTFEQLADAINEVERRVRKEVPIARPMYIEPDIARDIKDSPAADDHHD
ncbi:MAG: cation diffusion facilitator family transporter [Acidimicrobiia bacterium]|nr:cation diffusion facilitator family transporter [Acidimicrobiia bacterium]MDX2468255.1 cation diffusion facilitator family transporter [Acidimicrobiia bacterium]